MKTLSIIIPTIGRETLPTVLEALGKCHGYEAINPEVIVVFDGRTENEILNQVQDDSIVFLKTEKKVYAAGARNLGLDHATGDIIVFLQDDTYPERDWLQRHFDFHQQNPEPGSALLGKVEWAGELAKDRFHQWLLNHAQFRYKSLEAGKLRSGGDNWRFFYTSNISLKRELIGDIKFSNQFKGWGFEDIEFGYRLGEDLEVNYDEKCKVFHDHPQTLEGVLANTRNARKNAEVFERLHPAVKVRPRGLKLFTLKVITFFLSLTPKFLLPKTWFWWREWKKAWIDKNN